MSSTTDAPVAPSTPSAPDRPAAAAVPSFAELGVPAPVVEALRRSGVETPFPIQAASLPDAIAGRDVLGRGRTGSGKTVAFSVPVVARLAASGTRTRRIRPRALVLVPTRELAAQVTATLEPLARALGLRVATVFGGVGQNPQVNALRQGADVVVACPGRLEDLIGQGHCRLDDVEVTVLDEADHMADLGFLPAVRRLLDATPRDGQRLLFSATLDGDVDLLVRRYLHDPVRHSVDPAESHVPTQDHHVLTVAQEDRAAVLRELAAGPGPTLVFTRTKYGAKKLATQLTRNGIPAGELHGNLSQGARSRNLDGFSSGRLRVLVATDIAARGIHVDGVRLVVHADPPAEHKAYLHRSGRTARAGEAGTVVTLRTPAQRREVDALLRDARVSAALATVAPGDPLLVELAGPTAPLVHAPAPTPQRDDGRRSGPRSGNAPTKGNRRRSGGRGGGSKQTGSGMPSTGRGKPSAGGGTPSAGAGKQTATGNRSGGGKQTATGNRSGGGAGSGGGRRRRSR